MARTRWSLLIVGASLALLAAACGDDGTGTAPPSPPPGATQSPGAEATIVAQETAFDTMTLAATVGEQLTITYDNRDNGIQHNLHVKATATGDAKTEISEGPVTQTLVVTFDVAGAFEYVFDCSHA